MRHRLLPLLLCTTVAAASAQSAPDGARHNARDGSEEQRRVELRIVLQAIRSDDVHPEVGDAALATRHLTVRERAEMRQQLRQLQPVHQPSNP